MRGRAQKQEAVFCVVVVVRAVCRGRLCCLLNGQNIDDLAGQSINGDGRGECTVHKYFVGILVYLLYKSFS